MANDSSLGSAAAAFDFDTQSGVMHLLASVRAGSISSSEKNELRDLIFLYSNGGHDQSVRNSLEQKLTGYAVVALPRPQTFAPPKIHEFGASRPAPAFKAEPVQVKVIKSEPIIEPAKPVLKVEPQSEPMQPEQQAVSAEIPANLPQEKPQEVHPVEVKASVVEPVVSASQADISVPSQEDSLQRIKQIKSLVNEQVGNPVNLVDINNEVGREYMAALLDAMKKISSGSSAASAMQRLESAFTRVEEALQAHGKIQTETQPEKLTSPVAEIAQTPVIERTEPEVEVQVDTTPAQPVEVPTKQFNPVQMDVRPIVSLAQSEKPTVPAPAVVTSSVHIAPQPVSTPTAPAKEPAQPAGSAWGPETDTVIEEGLKNSPTTAEVEPQQVSVPSRYQSATLAQSETKLRTPEDLPTASALETSSVAGNPLFTKQVDDGLNQLLSDWALFKKSGLFGTGAKGITHPLYLKVKDLQIPLLLAGRFEGATQEIKQSVTDYMNGWRYEQGIIYEQGETFDHYLRRVIRHILDLQKKT